MSKRVNLFLFFALTFTRLYFQSNSIVGGDAGELVTASYIKGVPHAPGFPLYTLIAHLIITLIPKFTVAWRVSLLSSIPSVLTAIILCSIIYKLTKNTFLSVVGSLIYSFIYPVWLFAEIPEVVSLNALFFSIVLYFVLCYLENKKKHYLLLISFFFGLGFFHNYIISLILPGLIFLIYDNKTKKYIKKNFLLYLSAFLAGVSPYLYSFIASSSYPALDSNHPANFLGLLKLITRYSYGTFRLSNNIFFNFPGAVKNLITLGNFIFLDFKFLGIFLIIIGIFYFLHLKNKFFYLIIINIFVNILFFCYASFPLTINYHLGVFEKYLWQIYFYLVISLIFGILTLLKFINNQIKNDLLRTIATKIILITFLLYFLIIFTNNYRKILVLKYDKTAENLGIDILNSAPKNSLVNLYDDTSYYNSLYVHHILKIRPDIILIRFDKLKDNNYQKYLYLNYPEIIIPNADQTDQIFLKNFLEINSKKFAILNTGPNTLVPETWLPSGLLWKYYPTYRELPESRKIILENLSYWQIFHSPLSGSLNKVQNLLISDVLRVYGTAHQSLGMLLLNNGSFRLAENEFKLSTDYLTYKLDSLLYLAKLYIKTKNCQEAEQNLKRIEKIKIFPDLYMVYIDLYGNCYYNETQINHYYQLFLELKKKKL